MFRTRFQCWFVLLSPWGHVLSWKLSTDFQTISSTSLPQNWDLSSLPFLDLYLFVWDKGWTTVYKKRIAVKSYGTRWRFKLMVCLMSDLMFCFSFVRAKKPVKMPGNHYVNRKLDVTTHNKDYTSVEQWEISIARHSMLGWLPFRFKLRQKYAVS